MIQLTEAQPLSESGPLCMGGAMTAEAELLTDLPGPAELELFVAFAAWTQPGAALGENPGVLPPGPYFSFRITPFSPLLTTFPMAWGGGGPNDANNQPARAYVSLDNAGGFLLLQFRFDYLNTMDFEGYPDGTRVPNADRLLKDRRHAAARLAVSAQSVYGRPKTLRAMCWLREPNGDVSGLLLESAPRALRFYNAEAGGAPPVLFHSPAFSLARGGQPVAALSAVDATTLRVEITSAGPVPQKCRLLFLRTDSQDDAVDYMENYELDYVEIAAGMTRPYAAWGVANPVFAAIPTTIFLPAGPFSFATEVGIDPARLDPAGRYRVAMQWEGSGPENYAFISPEFRADACPELCPPQVESRIADYRREYGAYVAAAPRERLESRLSFLTPDYDACRAAPFADAAARVSVRIYAETGGRRYVLQEAEGARGPAGWDLPAGFAVTPDPANDRWNLSYRFRLRADAGRTELYSEDLATGARQFTSDLTQDWTGRELFVEFRLRLAQIQPRPYADELVATQRVRVEDYDTAVLTGAFTDEQGAPLSRICPEDGGLRLCIESGSGADAALIGLVESDGAAEEHESFQGELPQLSAGAVAQMDADFVSGRACVVFDAARFAPGRRYRFVAIEKED